MFTIVDIGTLSVKEDEELSFGKNVNIFHLTLCYKVKICGLFETTMQKIQ